MADFEWKVEAGISGASELQTREVQFGDGYAQIQQKSLKPVKHKWKATRQANKVTIDEIVAFLNAKCGRSFTWFSPDGLLKVKVKSYTRTSLGGGVWKLDWEFEQV